MESYLAYIIPAILTFVVQFLLKFADPKGKLVYWSPNSFATELPGDANNPSIPIRAASLFISNIGKKQVENIEIAHKTKPEHFVLQPPLPYIESYTPTGEHIISINSLAPREQFVINFISFDSYPHLLYIRSFRLGHAKHVYVRPVFVMPRWHKYFSLVSAFVGIFAVLYFLTQFIIFTIYWFQR